METSKLKRFAQFARRSLVEQVSAKLKLVLAEGSAAQRENPKAVKSLEEQIKASSEAQVIEKMAYIWFNRFCALHYMDVNRYTRISVVSPAEGQFQPEILAEAKMGHIDEDMVPEKTRQQIFALLGGTAPSRNPQAEAYRLLVVAACNDFYTAMPFLFERIADYTELLMPDDLLSGNSILAYTREAMTPDVCQDVEVIGWLYQFYISEKKDNIFDALKKNKKITPENIPAATQLFTPHWIVRYLVENSLGRLWMLNRPQSRLIERMDYYVKPEQAETDFLRISKPEELKICDPACGSGHMLVYAFDLLYAIYEEEGYDPAEIPETILTHNLYGVEIDERAGELAAFALTMKARAKHRRFLSKQVAPNSKHVAPNICVLENALFNETTNEREWIRLLDELCKSGVDREDLIHDLRLFAEADNFGSLLRPRLQPEQIREAIDLLEAYDQSIKAPTFEQHDLISKCQMALNQANYLSPKYHVVVANPPYMGGKGMNERLKVFSQDNYPNSKADLFAMFIERNIDLAISQGMIAMITMQSWMFLLSFEKLRTNILDNNTIISMSHLGARAFDSIGGEVVSTTAFVIGNVHYYKYKGTYLRLTEGINESEKEIELRAKRPIPFLASATDFKKIPGSPIAYWISHGIIKLFEVSQCLSSIYDVKAGMSTTDNDRFLRCWHEVASCSFKLNTFQADDTVSAKQRWYPLNKGGGFRKWFGNLEYSINWYKNGLEIREYIAARPEKQVGGRLVNTEYFFRECFTWGDVAGGYPSFRYLPKGLIIGNRGPIIYSEKQDLRTLAFLNSRLVREILSILNPTLTYNVGNIASIPNPDICIPEAVGTNAKKLVHFSEADWNSYETSWDFTSLPLLHPVYRQPTLKATYAKLREHWQEMTLEMQRLEEENNHIFIDAYGLQDELTPDVPLKEITLTCNPHYRYSDNKSEEELEALLLAETMKEFISYAVGCMFGRYSLDKPGLILANQGETVEDYYKKIGTTEHTENTERDGRESSFEPTVSSPPSMSSLSSVPSLSSLSSVSSVSSVCSVVCSVVPVDKNVVPILDGDWFPDDISERFRKFLRVTFGEEHYEENLNFIEKALGKDIRKYFLKDFYSDHLKRYKKRPIYWLFSSPKGSFNALIYMHRYRPDTVSVVLNDYLREFRTKLSSRVDHLKRVEAGADTSQAEKTKALKEIEKLNKMIKELEDYEREVLYPLATEQVEIDLDDGVKVNYGKFGAALKKIPGMDAKED